MPGGAKAWKKLADVAAAAPAALKVAKGYRDERRGMAAGILWWDCESVLAIELGALPGGPWWNDTGRRRLAERYRNARREVRPRVEAQLAVYDLWRWALDAMHQFPKVFDCSNEVLDALAAAGWVFHARCKDTGRENRESGLEEQAE